MYMLRDKSAFGYCWVRPEPLATSWQKMTKKIKIVWFSFDQWPLNPTPVWAAFSETPTLSKMLQSTHCARLWRERCVVVETRLVKLMRGVVTTRPTGLWGYLLYLKEYKITIFFYCGRWMCVFWMRPSRSSVVVPPQCHRHWGVSHSCCRSPCKSSTKNKI